jgi:3-hydroxyisobutyrate dehydrogenase
MPRQPSIGWIGLGVMGLSMANHLLDSGLSLSVYSRTKKKADPLLSKGASWASSPAELAENSEYIFSMVGYPRDVENIYFEDNGIFNNLAEGRTLIDMTTSSPVLAERIALRAKEMGSFSMDAPVSGGDMGAKNASLAIMCGGDQTIYDQSLNLLQIMGKNVQLFGPAGSGQRVKMANQILIASTMIGTVESLLYAEQSNLDVKKVIALIGQGAAGCWSLNQLGPRMINEDWEPGFYVKHFIKDMGIALEDTTKMGLELKGLELAMTFYKQVEKAGYSENGTQVLIKVLKDLNAK